MILALVDRSEKEDSLDLWVYPRVASYVGCRHGGIDCPNKWRGYNERV